MKQTTLAGPVSISGVGLHTGVPVELRLLPAPPDTGYTFVRVDLGDFEIPASVESVSHCRYTTALMKTGVMVSTVEHLLSALRGSNIDNVKIEIDNIEVPILDGSSIIFMQKIEEAGVVRQSANRKALKVRRKVEVDETSRYISIEPSESYQINCQISFDHPMIGDQKFTFDLADSRDFKKEIAPARTFGFTAEIDALRSANLIRGGSLENAIVLTDDGMLNDSPLRFRDEFVRHKVLDIIGDLCLVGMPILGAITAIKSGHFLHLALMTRLLRDDKAWEIVDMPVYDRVVAAV
jgi:UDP-3-O-[3-hydroxymyristoyl] N-acetylglucosamine deacetylase